MSIDLSFLSPSQQRADHIPVPDLLHRKARLSYDRHALAELLETSFVGGGTEAVVEQYLGQPTVPPSGSWKPEFFKEELFLPELLEDIFKVRVNGQTFPVNQSFVLRELCAPPIDLEEIRFRQGILREIETNRQLGRRAGELYRELSILLAMFQSPHERAKLDINAFRLEVLQQSRRVIDGMEMWFAGARSGLSRIHEVGRRIQGTREYRLLTDLLDYENHLARLNVTMRIGAQGKIRNLEIGELVENFKNPFYLGPWRRLWERIQLKRRGFDFTRSEMVGRVVHRVFQHVSVWLKPVLQLLCHMGFYLSSVEFRRRSEELGLEVSIPDLEPDAALELSGLFNPLLFRQGRPPVPCDIANPSATTIAVVTGPNSGGKTRLLQAIGIAQLLGQSGLHVPAARARLPVVEGLFASTTERASVDQVEGRLGMELLRIRNLFESTGTRSLVILDELCSGTNPSEAVEIFSMVLRLLERLKPVGFITTHFLDYARELELEPPIGELEFIQVEMDDDETSTYQFLPGVAATSMATATAGRLGVTLGELSSLTEMQVRRSRKRDEKKAPKPPAEDVSEAG